MNVRDSEALRTGASRTHPEHTDYRDENSRVGMDSPHAPQPGIESAGPLMFDLVRESKRAMDVQNQLLKAAIPLLDQRIIVEKHTGTSDASGNLDIPLYRVPQGMQLVVTRCIAETAINSPGAPFIAAGAWIAMIAGDKFAPGSIRDFAPNPPSAGGTILPCLFSDGSSEASVFRGGEIITLHIVGTVTFANVDVWCTLQGHETPL